MAAPPGSDTPVMRQFLETKARFPDAVLFFRMGDFYEMFFDDAVAIAPVLDIALTTRDKNSESPIPMAGVPYHAVGSYLRTLVERGFKVAICEQMESPEQARRRRGADKIVRREVVRVVTPGVLVDEEHLKGTEPNYLIGLAAGTGDGLWLAALDVSSSDFELLEAPSTAALRAEIGRLQPRELAAPAAVIERLVALGLGETARLQLHEPSPAAAARVRALAEHGGLGPLPPEAIAAAATALGYAESTQPGKTLLLHRIRRHLGAAHLVLDEVSLRNLEIFRTQREGRHEGSLLWAIDATTTAGGARMLRGWIGAPLCERGPIEARLDAVDALAREPRSRRALQSQLRDVRDVARLANRARLGSASPRELGALRDSLRALPQLRETLREIVSRRIDRKLPALLDLGEDLGEDLAADLGAILVDQPPILTREGGMVREGADAELDRQRGLQRGGQEALAAIEARERERSGIPNLRVLYNRVFGYSIEVSRSQLKRVPTDYVRKQTTTTAERFVTEELARHEAEVLGAQAAALERELELFGALRNRVGDAGERLCALAERLAILDCAVGLAEVADTHGYVRPILCDDARLSIGKGRHPVVERMLERGRFVPNDVELAARGPSDEPRILLVTGPNMGGKSTIMRQCALIAVLAHAGSFVPAERAEVGLIDRLFTRVGAGDDLGRGESTFMVEMRETAQILAQATPRSLVLLDEIGRGTATFDGLALACAILEHLHDQVGCRTLFSTHYHELCALQARLRRLANVHVEVSERAGEMLFLHRLRPGPAGRSYGIHVGRLAGLPSRVLVRAQRVLEQLERADRRGDPQLDLFAPPAPDAAPAPGPGPAPDDGLVARLREIDPDDLSPRAALDLLVELRRLALSEGSGPN